MTEKTRLKKIYRDRWKKLFAFLEALPRRKFDFSVIQNDKERYVGIDHRNPSLKICATSACVAGWMPTVFPKYWSYDDLKKYDPYNVADSGDFSYFMLGIEDRVEGVEMETLLLMPSYEEGRIEETVTPKQWIRGTKKILRSYDIDWE